MCVCVAYLFLLKSQFPVRKEIFHFYCLHQCSGINWTLQFPFSCYIVFRFSELVTNLFVIICSVVECVKENGCSYNERKDSAIYE